MRPKTRDEFEIAIICALVHEADAVEALFDETYDSLSRTYGKQSGDANTYTNGRIGQHNVVLCYMPGMGIGNAASVASSLRVSYTKIKLALVVGICGGVPFPSGGKAEIFLGDIIVSDSVIQYDFGRQYPDGFQRKADVKETLGRPIREIRTLLSALQTRRTRKEFQGRIAQHLKTLEAEAGMEYGYPGAKYDILFEASSRHKHYQSNSNGCICFDCKLSDDPVCDDALRSDCTSLQCEGRPVYRSRRLGESTTPSIHFGTIASASTVMKSGEHRDRLAGIEGIIGFEMEGAGVWDNMPCIIIKGVCDYADSHKNKKWQDYSAATGACAAKAFLEYWLPTVTETLTDDDKCLTDLLLSDPSDDKLRIEDTKGGLLNDSFRWILEDHIFRQWRSEEQSQLLWIKGDAGKGKTMLMIGIMDELSREREMLGDSRLVSYFLCEGTNSNLNNATAVLRGLIYNLCVQQPLLTQHLRKKYDHHGQKLFEGASAFYSLSGILDVMLRNSTASRVYLLIDAVDECEAELDALLNLIMRTTKESPIPIKWIISSRNRDDIEQGLGVSDSLRRLSLELNADHISSAIDAFIECKVSQLVSLKHSPDTRAQIKDQIRRKSDGTFLWVALIIKELRGSILEADVAKVLNAAPIGLVPLYDQMMQRIELQDDRNSQRCFAIMSAATLAYRPLRLHEMRVIAGLDQEISQLPDLERIVNMCCSFFTIRDHSVYFIHQSAKDYLTTKRFAALFPNGREKAHYDIFSHSISTMSAVLRQNMYDLEDFGAVPDNFQRFHDPLASVKYSCMYWPDHLCELVVRKEEYTREFSDDKDAERFTLHFRNIMEQAPLQVYAAALAFCPIDSAVRDHFLNKPSVLIKETKGAEASWSGCLQRIKEHTDWVNSVKFSPDGQILASASSDSMIHLVHVASGTLQRTLKGHKMGVTSISFSPDGSTLASGSEDGTVQIWRLPHGTRIQIYQSHGSFVTAIAFSPDGEDLACVLSTGMVQLWNTASGTWREILQGQKSVAEPSYEETKLRHAYRNHMEGVADYAASTIEYLKTRGKMSWFIMSWFIKGPAKTPAAEAKRKWLAAMNRAEKSRQHKIESLSFSPDGKRMVFGSQSGAAHLWDRESARWKQIFHHEEPIKAVAFSPDGRKLALSTEYCKLYTWNTTTEIWKDHSRGLLLARALAFSPTGQSLASSLTHEVHLWNEGVKYENKKIGSIQKSREYLSTIDFSPSGNILATGTLQGEVLLWRVPYEYRDRENFPLLSRKLDYRENLKNCASRITDKQFVLANCAWIILFFLVSDEVFPGGLVYGTNADQTQLSPSSSPPDQDTISLLCKVLLVCDLIWFISLYAAFGVVTIIVFLLGGIAISDENRRQVKAMSLASEKHLRRIKISLDSNVTNHIGEVLEISPSHEASILISTSIAFRVKVLDMNTKKSVKEIVGPEELITKSQKLAGSQIVLSFSRDACVSVWNVQSGTCKEIKAESEPKFPEAAPSPDGQVLAQLFKDKKIRFFDTVTGVCVRALAVEEEDLRCITFSPDNQALAYFPADTGTIRLWDTDTYGTQYILEVEGIIKAFAFSPDSQSIAVALSDSAIQLWNWKEKACVQAFTGGEGFAKVIAFSWDSKSIASISQDSSIRVWNIATGTLAETFRANVEVKKLAFASDNRYLRTDRGLLALNVGGPMDSKRCEELAWTPFVEKEWVLLGGRKALWIPPDFRDRCCATYWTTVVLGQESGRLTFIDFKHPDPNFKFPHTSL
ncbi:hypothetical protein AWENTII_009765 [Aspergillus wentii]